MNTGAALNTDYETLLRQLAWYEPHTGFTLKSLPRLTGDQEATVLLAHPELLDDVVLEPATWAAVLRCRGTDSLPALLAVSVLCNSLSDDLKRQVLDDLRERSIEDDDYSESESRMDMLRADGVL